MRAVEGVRSITLEAHGTYDGERIANSNLKTCSGPGSPWAPVGQAWQSAGVSKLPPTISDRSIWNSNLFNGMPRT